MPPPGSRGRRRSTAAANAGTPPMKKGERKASSRRLLSRRKPLQSSTTEPTKSRRASKKKRSGGTSSRTQSRSTMRRRLDKLAREVVLRRDGHRCRWCSKKAVGRDLQWCHIYSRRYLATRWLPENAVTLCASCHRKGHDRPTEFTQWLNNDGVDLEALSAKLKKPVAPDLEKMEEWLRWKLEGFK